MSNYQKDLAIDEMALDREWIKQPKNFMSYAALSAETDHEAKKAKELLEVVKAELYLSIREDREASKEKVTEGILEAAIKVHPEFQKANSAYLDALHSAQILKAAVQAFEQKKSALENLVKLTLAGYFSEPVSENSEDMKESATEKTAAAQRKKLNKKKEKK